MVGVNRSVPVDTILPHVFYDDVAAAIEWLTSVFGFEEHYHYGNVEGAQMRCGKAWLMLGQTRSGRGTPAKLGYESQCLTVFIEDVQWHYERAKAAGARIVEVPNETMYGEFQYVVEDLAGHRWVFSWHAKDVNPAEWGAVVKSDAH